MGLSPEKQATLCSQRRKQVMLVLGSLQSTEWEIVAQSQMLLLQAQGCTRLIHDEQHELQVWHYAASHLFAS